jgi:Na+/H+ antiporter NhaC
MRHAPGPWSALAVAVIVAVMYAQGGVFQTIAALIILAVLITPVNNQPSLLEGGLKYLDMLLTQGIQSGE